MCLGLLSFKIFSDSLMKITGGVFLPSLFFLQLIFIWQCSLKMLSLFSKVMSQLTKRVQSFSQELTPAHIFSSHIFRHMGVPFGGNSCSFAHIGSICKEIPCKYCCSVLEIKLKHYSSRPKENIRTTAQIFSDFFNFQSSSVWFSRIFFLKNSWNQRSFWLSYWDILFCLKLLLKPLL